jgi:hypothetical protein
MPSEFSGPGCPPFLAFFAREPALSAVEGVGVLTSGTAPPGFSPSAAVPDSSIPHVVNKFSPLCYHPQPGPVLLLKKEYPR